MGLGYVGLPLFLEFNRIFPGEVFGFDRNSSRVDEIRQKKDRNSEVEFNHYTHEFSDGCLSSDAVLPAAQYYICTVPTPVDEHNNPETSALQSACLKISDSMVVGSTVVFESTVYPGFTEEVCVPLLAKSGLKYKAEFFVGYSPERINPGDPGRQLTSIVKIVSGCTREVALDLTQLYSKVISAGIHQVNGIEIAEMAKVIENVQRDVNIALMNELSILCRSFGLDSGEVFSAAATKWNFIRFAPGLVGGHCIPVDPYYLASKARSIGIEPKLICAGREINEAMTSYILKEINKLLESKKKSLGNCRVLLLGLTFKENCADFRNSKALELAQKLSDSSDCFLAVDPFANVMDSSNPTFNFQVHHDLSKIPDNLKFDLIVVAVGHTCFQSSADYVLDKHAENQCIVVDLKSIWPAKISDFRL